ncbi:hypothetical protein AAC387_Pa06g2462 [Persea americana]
MMSFKRFEIQSMRGHLLNQLLTFHMLPKVMKLLRKRLHLLHRVRGSNWQPMTGLISWPLSCRDWLRMLMRDFMLLMQHLPLCFRVWDLSD